MAKSTAEVVEAYHDLSKIRTNVCIKMTFPHDFQVFDDAARAVRRSVVKMSYQAQASHLASSLSCVDILIAALWGVMKVDLKNNSDPDRD